MAYRYPQLAAAQARAKSLGLPIPVSSTRPTKKLMVVYNGHTIHFGARGMSDYLIHGDKERRKRYRARARGAILADGSPAYLNKNQPAYWSYYVLW